MYIVSKVMDHNGKLDEEEHARISPDPREKYRIYYSSSRQCPSRCRLGSRSYVLLKVGVADTVRLRINYESVHKTPRSRLVLRTNLVPDPLIQTHGCKTLSQDNMIECRHEMCGCLLSPIVSY
jgi:hypothetical protein